MTSLYDTFSPESFARNFFDNDEGHIFEDHSLIYKQFKKQNRWFKSQLLNWFSNYPLYVFEQYKDHPIFLDINKFMYEFCEVFRITVLSIYNDMDIDTEKINKLYEDFGEIEPNFQKFPFEAKLLDMYTLLRIFKQLDDKVKPKIIVTYFGEAHIDRITKFLTETANCYTNIYSTGPRGKEIKDEEHTKCVKFTEDIDINSILEQYQ